MSKFLPLKKEADKNSSKKSTNDLIKNRVIKKVIKGIENILS